jgi:hypothetical protein
VTTKYILAVTVESFQFSPAVPVAYEWSETLFKQGKSKCGLIKGTQKSEVKSN